MTDWSMPHDVILHNARVYTGAPNDRDRPPLSTLWVRGKRVAAVGGDDLLQGVRSASDPTRKTLLIDVDGRAVTPGFIDAHCHLTHIAELAGGVDVSKAVSVRQLQEKIRAAVEHAAGARWIRCYGMDHTRFAEGSPTRFDIDEVSGGNPVAIFHSSYHHVLVNTKALRLAGISDEVRDPPGGSFQRDRERRLTGFCFDSATEIVIPTMADIGSHGPGSHFAIPTHELLNGLGRITGQLHSRGITAVCDAQTTKREMDLYSEAAIASQLPVRVRCLVLSNHLFDLERLGLRRFFGNQWLGIGGIKVYSDGSLLGGTAAFSEPYGPDGAYSGAYYWDDEDFERLVERVHRAGWNVCVHAHGDVAIDRTLDAIERSRGATGGPLVGHGRLLDRIEHATDLNEGHLARLKKLDIGVTQQPLMLEMWSDTILEWFGRRARSFIPLRKQLDIGVASALSSDAPITPTDPLRMMEAVTAETSFLSSQIGWRHQLTPLEALECVTYHPARMLGWGETLGSLQPGKLADVCVIDGDPFDDGKGREVDGSLRVGSTLIGGRAVFDMLGLFS